MTNTECFLIVTLVFVAGYTFGFSFAVFWINARMGADDSEPEESNLLPSATIIPLKRVDDANPQHLTDILA